MLTKFSSTVLYPLFRIPSLEMYTPDFPTLEDMINQLDPLKLTNLILSLIMDFTDFTAWVLTTAVRREDETFLDRVSVIPEI
jgi:hypothetical protein